MNKRPRLWLAFHIILGYISIYSKWILVCWFGILIFSAIFQLTKRNSRYGLFRYLSIVSYVVSFELLARMADCSPFVPYEASKYFLIVFYALGLLIFPNKGYFTGACMIILILPAFFYDLSNQSDFNGLVFNGFPSLALALGVTFLGKIKVEIGNINTILRLIWLTSVSSLAYAAIKTPEFDSIAFGFGANFETTGGESSNQVSSIFGLGMVLSFYSWFNKLRFTGYRNLDLAFVTFFAFQGLLTFSRGGMMVGLLAVIIIYLFSDSFLFSSNQIKRLRIPKYYILIVFVVGVFVFSQVDKITGGKLTLRYQGETEGTYLGVKDKNLNVITTNRLEILEGDIELWRKHFFWGVGVGSSKYMRSGDNSNPHVEMSRLISEHGLLGLCYFFLFLYLGLRVFKVHRYSPLKGILLALFVLGFLTSFHSAMRTYITPLLVPLASMIPHKQKV